jgi:hypothetical protein
MSGDRGLRPLLPTEAHLHTELAPMMKSTSPNAFGYDPGTFHAADVDPRGRCRPGPAMGRIIV